jgi:hypothetical protein
MPLEQKSRRDGNKMLVPKAPDDTLSSVGDQPLGIGNLNSPKIPYFLSPGMLSKMATVGESEGKSER